jgi:hypothetical protein
MDFASDVIEFGRRSKELVESLGLTAPNLPQTELIFPADLSMMHSEDLGAHLSYWASLCAYGHSKVAVLEGALIIAKQQLDEEVSMRLYAKQGHQGTATEKKSAVMSSKAVRGLFQKVATIEADLKVLKAVVMGYDMKNSAISREISRRHNEKALRDG